MQITKIEKIVLGLIAFLLVGVIGSCSLLVSQISECKGLEGVVEMAWSGEECPARERQ